MKYSGVVITGTSGAGKSTLVNRLCNIDTDFARVKAVTTRQRRSDDPSGVYEYTAKSDFEKLSADNRFIISTTYRGECYGIRFSDLQEVIDAGKIPVLTITPASVNQLVDPRDTAVGKNLPRYLSVFLDAANELLDERLKSRTAVGERDRAVEEQRLTDRKHSNQCHYTIKIINVESVVNLIKALWDAADVGGVVPDRIMRLMLECGMLLEDANLERVSGASYDLSLGDEYFYGIIRQLSDKEPILLIEPYDYAIVTSHESSNLPRDICARFDLSVGLFCQGIILSNGPQIDPGFRGPLFCLLFNTSSSPVLLKRRHHYATLEFHKLIEPTYSYSGQYQAKSLLEYLPSNAARGAINELKKELEEVRKESLRLQNTTWAILALILALLAVWLSVK
jgi:guanylate kinase/deoxycytidine triphosphate deaminase